MLPSNYCSCIALQQALQKFSLWNPSGSHIRVEMVFFVPRHKTDWLSLTRTRFSFQNVSEPIALNTWNWKGREKGFDFLSEATFLLFSEATNPTNGPNPTSCLVGAWSGRITALSALIKNAWSYTSTPSFSFMSCCLNYRHNLTWLCVSMFVFRFRNKFHVSSRSSSPVTVIKWKINAYEKVNCSCPRTEGMSRD